MQYPGQKRGQFGLSYTAAQRSLGGAGRAQALEQCAPESVDIIGSAVGERVLGDVPGGLDGVELRSGGGQTLQMQPRISSQRFAQRPCDMTTMELHLAQLMNAARQTG